MFYVGFSGWEQYDGYATTLDHRLGWATSLDGKTWTRGLIPEAQTVAGQDSSAGPLRLRDVETGEAASIAAHRVDDRIHLWITDEWDGTQGVGYYLFDPIRAANEDQQ